MLRRLLPLFLLCFILTSISYTQNLADSGYYYQKIGFKDKAAGFFEEYLYQDYTNYQVRLDLAYLYMDMRETKKARDQFDYVAKNSPNENEIKLAKDALINIDGVTGNSKTSTGPASDLDSGYYYLNQGNKKKAAVHFERHISQNPKDYKVRLQLAYIYYDRRKLDKSLYHFEYVGRRSTDAADVEIARSSAFAIKDELAGSSKRSLDLYFYNYYDSYQENYIANLVIHLNFRIAPKFYAGPYLDLYTDTRSSPQLIYNDRFIELGGFMRYNLLKNLFLEFRLGYARQIDLDTSRINIKPMMVYFNRFGNAKIYSKSSSSSKTSFYMDIYYAAMYDYKYENAFLQATMQQVVRFSTGGYSYIENYLVENAQFDSRRLDYNNYFEIGTGIRFKPNVSIFPVIFVEPSYKAYFYGNRENSFQLKAGFFLNFRTKI
jgi:hypothetical protein